MRICYIQRATLYGAGGIRWRTHRCDGLIFGGKNSDWCKRVDLILVSSLIYSLEYIMIGDKNNAGTDQICELENTA